MKNFARIPAAIAGFLLMIWLLYLAVASFTFDTDSYMQTPPYDSMARELVDYLRCDREGLSDTLFTQRERLHMVDVLDLFAGGRRMALGCFWVAAGMVVLSLALGGRRSLGSGLVIGIAGFVGAGLCIALWAAMDFSGWFETMHILVFTNDLWQLDPAKSRLINMMPLSFFMRAVKVIGLRFLAGALALFGVALLLRIERQPKEEENTWTTRLPPPML